MASFNSNNALEANCTGITFSGTDNLTIQVCDLVGVCTTAMVSIVVAIPSSIIVYNAISPNDDSFNPYFKIENIEIVEPQNKVSIFNRWGDKVFEVENYENNNPAKRFNGKRDNGKETPSGSLLLSMNEFTKWQERTSPVT
ncbi:MAG: gliding motility-associated C-terminal domain-containing protein [Cytophagales bacterium]|nr:gliding motility-associated C-terminal domain-containing protein [Cytophagales bacterium]